jgi:hypothetical protein
MPKCKGTVAVAGSLERYRCSRSAGSDGFCAAHSPRRKKEREAAAEQKILEIRALAEAEQNVAFARDQMFTEALKFANKFKHMDAAKDFREACQKQNEMVAICKNLRGGE